MRPMFRGAKTYGKSKLFLPKDHRKGPYFGDALGRPLEANGGKTVQAERRCFGLRDDVDTVADGCDETKAGN